MAELHSRLEPFLLLARTTKGAAAAKVVLDATAANGVYVFSELLELPNIKDLGNDPTFEKHHRLLQLFTYGTLKEYAAAPDSFPPLTDVHQAKLKHLTLVSLALQNRSLLYEDIRAALQVSSTRELENLIIDVIYADLLGGKMYHQEEMFHVDWVGGRDVSKDGLVHVKTGLENWCKNAETLLTALDEQIAAVRDRTLYEAERETAYTKARDEAYLEVRKSKSKSGGGDSGGAGAFDGMDMDEEDGLAIDIPLNLSKMMEGRMRSSSQRSVESIEEPSSQRAKKRAKD